MAQLVYTGNKTQIEQIITYIEQKYTPYTSDERPLRWRLQHKGNRYILILKRGKQELLKFKLRCPFQTERVDFYETDTL